MSAAVICPTITAYEPHQYREQMERIKAFAERVHIDLMDGQFAPTKSPELAQIWWPDKLLADIHLMYTHPMEQLEQLIKLKPHLVIIHSEASTDHRQFAEKLQAAGIKSGLALLQATEVSKALDILPAFDHILIFSGHLGYHGGRADLSLADKVRLIAERFPDKEIGWDGGINADNAKLLVETGVSVLNVGGYIAEAIDPKATYKALCDSLV